MMALLKRKMPETEMTNSQKEKKLKVEDTGEELMHTVRHMPDLVKDEILKYTVSI